jgi:hypothetical protein
MGRYSGWTHTRDKVGGENGNVEDPKRLEPEKIPIADCSAHLHPVFAGSFHHSDANMGCDEFAVVGRASSANGRPAQSAPAVTLDDSS